MVYFLARTSLYLVCFSLIGFFYIVIVNSSPHWPDQKISLSTTFNCSNNKYRMIIKPESLEVYCETF